MHKQALSYVITLCRINTRDSHNKNKTIRQPAILIFAYDASQLQYELLKEGQKTVEGRLSGQDVFVCFPTGSGNSLCFEIAALIDWVKFGPPEEENKVPTICVVVAPLSFMHDLVASLKRKGIATICIEPECLQEDIKTIQNGHYNLVLAAQRHF